MYLVYKLLILILLICISYIIINTTRCSIFENLINYKSNMVDNLSQYPISWLETQVKLLKINIKDIPEIYSYKLNLVTAIINKYPKDGLEFIKYENRNLNNKTPDYLQRYAKYLHGYNSGNVVDYKSYKKKRLNKFNKK